VDFKLENVLVSLHSLKTMGLGPFEASVPLFLRNGELRGHSPIRIVRFVDIGGIVGGNSVGITKVNIMFQFLIYAIHLFSIHNVIVNKNTN
jgi:hypothetical protein